MSDRLETVVVVTDKGSQTFTKIGDSATKMGTSIDKATTTGSTGLGRLNKAGAIIGGTFVALQGTLTEFARAGAEAEASHARLATAIEDSGHFISEYKNALEEAGKQAVQLGFDDETAFDSIAKLTTATGDANKAIRDVAIAEDISRARKIDLASATQIVIAAEQGRLGALNRVGIQLDKNSTEEERIDALRAKFAGNADAYANTTAGAMDRIREKTSNVEESIGQMLGPFQTLVALGPGLQVGFTTASAALGAMVPEMTAAAVGAAALDLALGPVGIALAAVGAGIAIYKLSGYLKDDFAPSADSARSGIDKLTASLNSFIQASSPLSPLAKQTTDDLKYITDATANYQQRLHDLSNEQEQAQQDYESYSQIRAADTQGIEERRQKLDSLNATLGTLRQQEGLAGVSATELAKATDSAYAVLNDTGPAAEAARNQLKYLDDSVQDGSMSWSDYLKGVNDLAGALPAMNLGMIEAAGGTKKAAEATKAAAEANKEYINTATGYRQSIAVLGDQFTTLDGQTQTLTTDHASLANAIATGNEMFAAEQEAAKQATAEFITQAEAVGGLDTALEKLIAANVSTWAERTANRVLKSTEGLGSLMSVIIDGTKNLSGQSQGLNDWAVDLINVAGSYGKIDDLLAHGQISLTTYNQAQEAGTRIFADNAAVQEDLLRIQAKQAPLLADAADQQAKYIDQLADLPAKQELVALGWMDQNEAMKANAALALAAAAANGEYGAAGEAAATAAITAQAQADPAFAAMLEDMGVISVGADGTITVNFPDSETIQEAVDGLTASVDALTIALGGIPPNVSTTVTANTLDASLAVSGFSAQLDSINGKQVYTSVYVDKIGPGVNFSAPYGRDGGIVGATVPHYATGGITGDSSIVRMNEAGGETVRLPNGSLIYPAPASREMARNRAGGNIIIHNMTVVANNPRDFSDQMRSFNFGYGARS